MKDGSPDKRDQMSWSWTRGAQSSLLDFGDPLDTTGYTLCVYDQSANPQPRVRIALPAGGVCAGRECWAAVHGGYKYGDRNALLGLRTLELKEGAAGKARLSIRGKGVHLPLPTLGFTLPVTVQLKNDAGRCWGAPYSSFTRNDAAQFKAKSD